MIAQIGTLVSWNPWPVVSIVLAVALTATIVGGFLSRRRAGSVVEAGRDELERDRTRLERQMAQRRCDLEADIEGHRQSLDLSLIHI